MSAVRGPWELCFVPRPNLLFFLPERHSAHSEQRMRAAPFFLLALSKHFKINTSLGHSPSYCRIAPLLCILSRLPRICSLHPIFSKYLVLSGHQYTSIVWATADKVDSNILTSTMRTHRHQIWGRARLSYYLSWRKGHHGLILERVSNGLIFSYVAFRDAKQFVRWEDL